MLISKPYTTLSTSTVEYEIVKYLDENTSSTAQPLLAQDAAQTSQRPLLEAAPQCHQTLLRALDSSRQQHDYRTQSKVLAILVTFTEGPDRQQAVDNIRRLEDETGIAEVAFENWRFTKNPASIMAERRAVSEYESRWPAQKAGQTLVLESSNQSEGLPADDQPRDRVNPYPEPQAPYPVPQAYPYYMSVSPPPPTEAPELATEQNIHRKQARLEKAFEKERKRGRLQLRRLKDLEKRVEKHAREGGIEIIHHDASSASDDCVRIATKEDLDNERSRSSPSFDDEDWDDEESWATSISTRSIESSGQGSEDSEDSHDLDQDISDDDIYVEDCPISLQQRLCGSSASGLTDGRRVDTILERARGHPHRGKHVSNATLQATRTKLPRQQKSQPHEKGLLPSFVTTIANSTRWFKTTRRC